MLPHTVRMVQDWILLLMVFGVVDSNVPSLMCECLIPTLPHCKNRLVVLTTEWLPWLHVLVW